MTQATEILERLESGETAAADELLPLVYDELRQLAGCYLKNERADHTLQATALVHEAFLRLVGPANGRSWQSRGHFFAAASEAMRRILVDSARTKNSRKRGGGWRRTHLDTFIGGEFDMSDLLLDLDDGLSQLEREDRVSAELVKLRLFAGLSVNEAGQALGLSRTTAYETWAFARSWFATRFDSGT
jgi:RNA polymerase sigma factor (TIGR02999 family)